MISVLSLLIMYNSDQLFDYPIHYISRLGNQSINNDSNSNTVNTIMFSQRELIELQEAVDFSAPTTSGTVVPRWQRKALAVKAMSHPPDESQENIGIRQTTTVSFL